MNAEDFLMSLGLEFATSVGWLLSSLSLRAFVYIHIHSVVDFFAVVMCCSACRWSMP